MSPRSFRTSLAGLFLFVPLLEGVDLGRVVQSGRLPGSKMIPPEQAVRSLLALKLLGAERKSHVMDLVFDPAVALFAGLNVVPKRSYLAAYSSRVDHRANLRLMDAWFEQVEQIGLPHGSSLDLDFHMRRPRNSTTNAPPKPRRSSIDLPRLKRGRPAAVLFDHVVDLLHEADGFGEGDDNAVVVLNIILRKGPAFAIFEPLLADPVTADMEIPHRLRHAGEASSLRLVHPHRATRPRDLLHLGTWVADEPGKVFGQFRRLHEVRGREIVSEPR
jgi:hypothetical protein